MKGLYLFVEIQRLGVQTSQEFHAKVERETGRSFKYLHSDNCGEYTSFKFKDYCVQHGIRHEKTVPGTPQHNGVAERMIVPSWRR